MNLISEQAALDQITPLLEFERRVAVDTEADSMHCYFEKLCLIQISLPGGNFLIDPLADISLQNFFERLTTREIIFHGADYDLRLMRRAGCPVPVEIFDTMIAARLTGRTEYSLSALIREFFGVELAKGSQKANWAQRPLPAKMLEYATNDTRYLSDLARRLESDLRQLGRIGWFKQSCDRAVTQAQISRWRDPEKIWRISGSSKLSGKESAVLRELWKWRDDEARRADRPAFHILHNQQLLEAAVRAAGNEVVTFPRMSSSRAKRFRQALRTAQEVPESEWPKMERKPRLKASSEQLARLKDLKSHRDKVAARILLDPSLIAPKATLEKLAFDPQCGLDILLPWQRELMNL
jgi:ribonuclease D